MNLAITLIVNKYLTLYVLMVKECNTDADCPLGRPNCNAGIGICYGK